MGRYVNGPRIREILEAKGMNQMDLVRETKLSINTISQTISHPEHNPSIDTLARIARVLEVSIYELIFDTVEGD